MDVGDQRRHGQQREAQVDATEPQQQEADDVLAGQPHSVALILFAWLGS